MSATLEDRLASVEAAISAIESGAQEYRLGDRITGRLVRKADLATLYKERRMLLNDIAAQSIGYNNRILVK